MEVEETQGGMEVQKQQAEVQAESKSEDKEMVEESQAAQNQQAEVQEESQAADKEMVNQQAEVLTESQAKDKEMVEVQESQAAHQQSQSEDKEMVEVEESQAAQNQQEKRQEDKEMVEVQESQAGAAAAQSQLQDKEMAEEKDGLAMRLVVKLQEKLKVLNDSRDSVMQLILAESIAANAAPDHAARMARLNESLRLLRSNENDMFAEMKQLANLQLNAIKSEQVDSKALVTEFYKRIDRRFCVTSWPILRAQPRYPCTAGCPSFAAASHDC